MANSILVRGARDVGRAKITDPYKFSAWIRSMFYGLDKLEDRTYNMKMSQIAAASKLRSDQMKQMENLDKLNRADMKRYHEAYNAVGVLPTHLQDVNDQIGDMYNSFRQATDVKSRSNPLSPDFSVATNIQDGVLKTFTEWKGLFNDYQGLADQLREAMNPDNDDLSRAHDWDRALFYNMILPDNHRIRFVQNDAGKEDIAFIFDNPYDEEIASVSKYRVTDPDTNEEVYGILLSDFIADHGGFFLKNKGRDADIEADWEKMEKDVDDGEGYMYFTPKDGIKQKVNRDEFISMYPWRNTFTKEKTITTADGTTMTVNRNRKTNLQAMAFDYDPDGSAYGQTTFAESSEAMLIQNYYIEWLAERDDLSKDQVLAMMNSGDQNFYVTAGGGWYHVVLTFDGTNLILYVNGDEKDTNSNSNYSTTNQTGVFSIGRRHDTQALYYNGKIDEVTLWNTALSSNAIAALYNSGTGLSASTNSGNYTSSGNLVLYLKMDQNLEDSANSYDFTGNNISSGDYDNTGYE